MKLNNKKSAILILSAISILVLAFGFNAMLTLSSLHELHVDSQISKFQLLGKDLKRNIEKGLGFGKKLEKFVGIDKELKKNKQDMLEISRIDNLAVSIVLNNKSIPFSTNSDLIHSKAPPEALENDFLQAESKNLLPAPFYNKFGDNYYLTIPLWDDFQQQAAAIVISFDAKQLNALIVDFLKQNIQVIALILAGSFLLLVLLLHFSIPEDITRGNFPQKRIFIIVFTTILLGHILFSAFNVQMFKDYYLQISKSQASTLSGLIREDVEYLLDKGLDMDRLYQMDSTLHEIVKLNPEFNNIFIFNKTLRPMFMGTGDSGVNFAADPGEMRFALKNIMQFEPKYNITTPITKNDQVQGFITTNIDKEILKKNIYSVLLDSATIIAITILFMVELLILMIFFIRGKLEDSSAVLNQHYGLIRPAAFLFLFSIDVSKAFLPIYMGQLYEPLFGLSREIVTALPISAELFLTAVGFFFAGIWVDKRGWHEPFFSGLAVGCAGMLYSWLAPDAVNLIMARAFVGLSYGLTAMACQGFVIHYSDESNRARALSGLVAGIIAGSICGGAAGAMLAERIGFDTVFLCGAILLVPAFIYSIIFLRPALKESGPTHDEGMEASSPRQIIRFLADKNVLLLLACISFPIAIAIVGLLEYFVPVYLNSLGVSESNIGRILMLYGICIIYLAPLISSFVDKSSRKQSYIILQGLLGGVTFMVFYFLGGLPATIIAVIILGLSDSLTDAGMSYMLNLKITRAIGQAKAMGLFNTIIRGGQLLGPLIFGGLIATADIESSVALFGMVLFGLSIAYILFTRMSAFREIPGNRE